MKRGGRGYCMWLQLLCYSVGIPDSIYIHSEEVSVVPYVTKKVRVKVKAIGTLPTNQHPVVTEQVEASLSTAGNQAISVGARKEVTTLFCNLLLV
jgi:hypothetical protein